jgi:hypothetical protein
VFPGGDSSVHSRDDFIDSDADDDDDDDDMSTYGGHMVSFQFLYQQRTTKTANNT